MTNCPHCGGTKLVAVQYSYDDPFHYDGISEFMCPSCNRRWGRWTGNRLETGEGEPPYGQDRKHR